MEEIAECAEGVEFEVKDRKVVVKGPKGTLERDFDDPRFNGLIDMRIDNGNLVISSNDTGRKTRAMAGTIRAHAENMMRGVTHGYKYTLRVVYTHFPLTVSVEEHEVHIKNFLGEKGARIAKIKGDVEVHADKEFVTVSGLDVNEVSQTAANIEAACKLRSRDRRIFQDGIYIESRQLQTGEDA
jgi:large subunit ribosomal protein L6